MSAKIIPFAPKPSLRDVPQRPIERSRFVVTHRLPDPPEAA